jgi:hypothetical protein
VYNSPSYSSLIRFWVSIASIVVLFSVLAGYYHHLHECKEHTNSFVEAIEFLVERDILVVLVAVVVTSPITTSLVNLIYRCAAGLAYGMAIVLSLVGSAWVFYVSMEI